jgi:hypothetical protein
MTIKKIAVQDLETGELVLLSDETDLTEGDGFLLFDSIGEAEEFYEPGDGLDTTKARYVEVTITVKEL